MHLFIFYYVIISSSSILCFCNNGQFKWLYKEKSPLSHTYISFSLYRYNQVYIIFTVHEQVQWSFVGQIFIHVFSKSHNKKYILLIAELSLSFQTLYMHLFRISLCQSSRACSYYLSQNYVVPLCRMNFTLRHMDVSCEAYDHFSYCLSQLEDLVDGRCSFRVEQLPCNFAQFLLYERIEQLVWEILTHILHMNAKPNFYVKPERSFFIKFIRTKCCTTVGEHILCRQCVISTVVVQRELLHALQKNPCNYSYIINYNVNGFSH